MRRCNPQRFSLSLVLSALTFSGQAWEAASAAVDGNYDCQIDMSDFGFLQACWTAVPGPEGSLLADYIRFDFDDDGDVDDTDFQAFLDVFTGPGETVDGCESACRGLWKRVLR